MAMNRKSGMELNGISFLFMIYFKSNKTQIGPLLDMRLKLKCPAVFPLL
jgi:hypothetical protein